MSSILQTVSATAVRAKDDAERVVEEFRAKIKQDISFIPDASTLGAVVDAIRHNDAIDDRKMLLEHVLVLLSRLPQGDLLKKLQDATVELLYLDLPHPPVTYIGSEHAFRTADGSYNNIDNPKLGQAGTPYSRSVQDIHLLPTRVLPDPGLVFDVLLKRDGFVKHPAGLSSLFFSFAALVIHSIFRTSHQNYDINETSSYVDLAPLYGNNQDEQNKVRVRDGRGLLHPDVFAENRLLLLPPATSVLLVLFNRNHNYIARKLLQINERGWYIDPDTIDPVDTEKNAKLLQQEEDIFQTARLVNASWFASVVMSDYFSNILGLVRDGNTWVLNPFEDIRKSDHSLFERGRGNACSVEFNCLYRWHATMSVADEQYTQRVFSQVFPDKPMDQVTAADFKEVAKKQNDMDPDCSHWTFGGLQRQKDGTFRDEDLANFLRNSTEQPAAAFRARGTPEVMRLNEIMGITQSRAWGCCSLNDFRKFLGLKPYSSFLEWNPDPTIAAVAEKLYHSIDNLELYVGLQAEEAKPVVEGAGLCPGYTISRAILADAIALTRGDRFFTADYTPYALTTWGFNDCQRDPNGPGFGSMLGRLFLRTLGDQCRPNSTYTWFPLMTPESMKDVLTNLGKLNVYEFVRPSTQRPLVVIDDYRIVKEILNNDNFVVVGVDRAAPFIKGEGFFIASSDPEQGRREQREFLRFLAGTPELVQAVTKYFNRKTVELIRTNTYGNVGSNTKNINIVRDVVRYAPVHWVATELAGIPIRSKDHPDAPYTEQQLYDIVTGIYEYLFLDIDPAKELTLQDTVGKQMKELLGHIHSGLSRQGSLLSGIWDTISSIFTGQSNTDKGTFAERFSTSGWSQDKMANTILAVLIGSTVELSQTLTHVINTYLDEKHASTIQPYSSTWDATAESVVQAFAREAIRLDPPFAGVYRDCRRGKSIGTLSVQAKDRVFLDMEKAHKNDAVFKHSGEVNQNRPKESYLIADGSTNCLGEELTLKIIAEMLQVVFTLGNVRRAPGNSGVLQRHRNEANQAARWEYLKVGGVTFWPDSMVLQYE